MGTYTDRLEKYQEDIHAGLPGQTHTMQKTVLLDSARILRGGGRGEESGFEGQKFFTQCSLIMFKGLRGQISSKRRWTILQ